MPNRSAEVDAYLRELRHAKKAQVEEVRAWILGADSEITERIKWNAPSFCIGGEDRVTMRLQPKDRLELIFHRGVAVQDASGFTFEDPDGLLEWAAPDRAVLSLDDAAEGALAKQKAKTVKLVKRWMAATRPTATSLRVAKRAQKKK